MKVLVLGGTKFVGPPVVESALERGWDVTCLHRGFVGAPPEGATSVIGDRMDPAVLKALAGEHFDIVVDTWSGAPSVARDAARALANSTGQWAYVSSRSVYDWPLALGAAESAPVVEADPDAGESRYPADKRGAELAYERELGAGRVVHLRAGLVLGPLENVGRLPWWLRRIARGGAFLAPGPSDLSLQYVDARDLAVFALDCARDGRSGAVNTVSPQGATTMGEILADCIATTGSAAVPVWVPSPWLLARGVEPWTELPIWIPQESEDYAMHAGDTSLAARWGLRIRPIVETVSAAWAWVQSIDKAGAVVAPARSGTGMDPVREVELLREWEADQQR
jgi:2'-hydroxyisoflavone reductase